MVGMEASRRADLLRASPRMFDNELLDRLSRVHPAVPVLIFLPAIVVLVVLAASRTGAAALVGLFVGGYFFWTLSEYWIHRVIFHFEPEDGFGARLHWIIHTHWYAFGAGFLAGYLIYDMTHYFLHHHKPKSQMGKRLRELHMRHHFQDHTTGFGISAPYWDKFFRTFPQKARRSGRETA
jgi:dihydroceramide fatty acyl 2-hydroxylase